VADEFVGREAAQDLEPTAVVVGIYEKLQVLPELVMAGVMVALDRGVLDGSVHPLDLTIRPRAARLGQAMLDLGLHAEPNRTSASGRCAADPGSPSRRPPWLQPPRPPDDCR
jgi:hypothetical protein